MRTMPNLRGQWPTTSLCRYHLGQSKFKLVSCSCLTVKVLSTRHHTGQVGHVHIPCFEKSHLGLNLMPLSEVRAGELCHRKASSNLPDPSFSIIKRSRIREFFGQKWSLNATLDFGWISSRVNVPEYVQDFFWDLIFWKMQQ